MIFSQPHFYLPLILACACGNVSSQSLLDSLKAHYTFNQTLSDFSAEENHITQFSGTYTTDRFGEEGNAFYFDGQSDSLVIPVSEFAPIAGDFTISLWYKTNSPQVMNLFSSKEFPSDTTNNFEIQLNSNNAYYLEYLTQTWYQTFLYWNGTGQNENAAAEGSAGAYTKGDWCHFAVVRCGDSLNVYRNHVLYTPGLNTPYDGALGDETELVFSAAPFRFEGAVDDLRLYNRALTQQEIDLLWFENQPITFRSPQNTDAYVQGSDVLVWWEYDDTVLSDSIHVEHKIDNGAWLPWPHSGLAAENAFYLPMEYPHGTLIEVRVTDAVDENISATIGPFTISEYDWVEVSDSLPFTARDGSGLLSFQNKMWLLGGWDPPYHPPTNTHSEVWSSADGVQWIFETEAPWPARHIASWISSGDAMYVVGGDPQSNCPTDVWKSEDGLQWIQLVDSIQGYPKRICPNYAFFNDKLFVYGGEQCSGPQLNSVWQSADGISWEQLPDAPWSGRGMQLNYCVDDEGQLWMLGGSNETDRRSFNEVWKTADGINWTLVNEAAPWTGRYWHTTAWFDGKMWLLGGMATGLEMNDVWYSEDGVDWLELKSTTGNWPYGSRHAQSTTVHDNALWYMCGILTNNAWKIINTETFDQIVAGDVVKHHFAAWPNPTSSILNMKFGEECANGYVSIFDATGRELFNTQIINAGASIDVSSLSSGCFLLKNDCGAVQRFVKW